MVSLQGGINIGRVKRAEVGTARSAGSRPSLPMAMTLQGIPVCHSTSPVHPTATQENTCAPQCFPREPPFPRASGAFPYIPLQPWIPRCTPGYNHTPRWAPSARTQCFLCRTIQHHVPYFSLDAPSPKIPIAFPCFPAHPSAPKRAPNSPFLPSPLWLTRWWSLCARNAWLQLLMPR